MRDLMDSVATRVRARVADDYAAHRLTASDIDALSPPDSLSDALRVRPFKEHDGIQSAVQFLESMHSVETSTFRKKNQSPAHSFEIRYTDEVINFQFVPGDREYLPTMERQLRDKYPDSQVERDTAEFFDLPGAGDLDDDRDVYVAGAELTTRRYSLYPIKHVDLEGFVRDPFGAITSEMVGTKRSDEPPADVAIQVLFRPAKRNWIEGFNGEGSIDDIAHSLQQPRYETRRRVFTRETIEHDPSDQARKAAKIVRDQHGQKGWHLNVRVFAASESDEVAVRRAEKAAEMFRNYYESSTEQTFEPKPLRGKKLVKRLQQATRREWTDQQLVKSQSEVAGLVHIPNSDINTQNVDWALAKAGNGVPPGTPRFDFDAAGVAGVETTREEKQVAMLSDQHPGDPFWYGWGSRSGIEAGVREDTLDTHKFVGGSTGQGKTTFGKNFFRQIMARGYGGMFYDPKGMDAEDFAALVPDHREDDLVYIEIGGDRDKQVGFNFLEVPVDEDPDHPSFSSAVESLTDDLTALLSQSGGDEDYWGPRMDRVSRNLIRGMAKTGRQCTLLDMYFALLSKDRRGAYAQMLSDDRVEWIEEYAREHLAEMDDSDLEPLVGRLQQWVENDLTREIVSYPQSTVSIEEAVADGKLIIVQDKSTSETVGTMIATALIRRIWVAIREQTNRGEEPPKFFAVLDEFNEIVSKQSSIAHILSDARSFGLSLTCMTQDLSAQLNDEVLDAIEGQCNTFISFNPGRSGDARLIAKQHSPDISDEDLLNLSKYKMYMRTHNDREELTHTYKVNAFPPLDDLTDVARTPEETESLITESLDRYGAKRRTTKDIKESSVLYSGSIDALDDDGEIDDVDRALVCKAVYDHAIRSESSDGFVRADEIRERVNRYLDREVSHTSQLWALFDAVPDDHLTEQERDDGIYIRCTALGATSIFETGAGASAGGGKHRALLKDAYDPLTRLGLEVALPVQSGGRDVDGIGRLRETLDVDLSEVSLREAAQVFDEFQADQPILSHLTDGADVTLEAESSTGRDKPAQTCRNLVKAYERDEKCLFLVREDVAQSVWNTLTSPPYLKEEAPDHFYNAGKLVVEGRKPVRPADAHATVWRYDHAREEVVLADSNGEVHGRFPDGAAVFSETNRYAKFADELDDDEQDEWTTVNAPFIPSYEFGEELPGRSDWEILVVPANADGDAALSLFDDGELVALDDLDDRAVSVDDQLDALDESLNRL